MDGPFKLTLGIFTSAVQETFENAEMKTNICLTLEEFISGMRHHQP